MKFAKNERGEEYIGWDEFMNERTAGIFFDTRCEYCGSGKEKYKECQRCGGPSRRAHIIDFNSPQGDTK